MPDIMQGDALQIPFIIVDEHDNVIPENQIDAIELVLSNIRSAYPNKGITYSGGHFSWNLTQQQTLAAMPGIFHLQYRIKKTGSPDCVKGEFEKAVNVKRAQYAEVI